MGFRNSIIVGSQGHFDFASMHGYQTDERLAHADGLIAIVMTLVVLGTYGTG
jgi:hypothetical protein